MNSFSKSLRVYLGHLPKPPYDFETRADAHSLFNYLVRGQFIKGGTGRRLESGLLESFEYDFRKKSYLIKLRPGLKFHNGKQVSSKDLEYSLLRGFFSKNPHFFSARLGLIKGTPEIKPGPFKSGSVTGVKIVDELSIEVSLSKPNPSFLEAFRSPYFSLIPLNELQDDHVSWKGLPIGAGKFTFKSINLDKNSLSLESTDSASPISQVELYWGPSVPSNIDVSFFPNSGFNTYQTRFPIGVRLIEFSRLHPLGKNFYFRKAIDLAIDRTLLKSNVFGVEGVEYLLPRHFWGSKKNTSKELSSGERIEQARKILHENIPSTVLKKKIDIVVYSGGGLSDLHMVYVKALKPVFDQLDLNVHFKPDPSKFITRNLANENPMFMSTKISDYVDPLVMFSSYRKDGHDEFLRASTDDIEKFDQFYSRCLRETDLSLKSNCVRGLNAYVKNRSIVVPIAEEKSVYFYNPARIISFGNQNEPLTLKLDQIELKK